MKKRILTTLVLCFILPHFAHADITTGMFGYWKLNDGGGMSATDSSGNSNDGTLTNGPTWATTGHITTNDLQYNNGLTTYVGTLNGQNTSSSFTWAEWVQPTGFTGVPSVHISTTQGIQFGTDNSGQIIFNDALGTNYATGVTLAANVWVHLAAVCIYSGGSNDELHIYKNGVEVYAFTGIIGGCGLLAPGASITLGQDGTNPSLNDGLDGYQQEVRVYNRALTASDITELFNYGTLILHYALEDNAANTTVIDSQALSNGTASTNTSALHSAGKIGTGSFLFNGTSQYVATNFIWPASQPTLTAAVWVKFAGGFGPDILESSDFNTPSWDIYYDHNNEAFGCELYNQSNVQAITISASDPAGTIPLSDGKWYHVACVYNGSTVQVYVNGVASGSGASQTGNIRSSGLSPAITIGYGDSHFSATGEYMNGNLDDACIYNRALSTADVVSLYNSTTGCASVPPSPSSPARDYIRSFFGWWD